MENNPSSTSNDAKGSRYLELSEAEIQTTLIAVASKIAIFTSNWEAQSDLSQHKLSKFESTKQFKYKIANSLTHT